MTMSLKELARIAAVEQMIPGAPIHASCSVDIAASVDKVWTTLVRVSGWERWNPYLKRATINGPFAPPSKVIYGGIVKHRLQIAKKVDRRQVMLYGTMMGYKGITRWDLEQFAEKQTRVRFTESSTDFLLGMLYSNKSLTKHLQSWLNQLKAETERDEARPRPKDGQLKLTT